MIESRRQNRHETIHNRKGGTHRSIAREYEAKNISLLARRRDAKRKGGGKIAPDNPSSGSRKMLQWNN